MPNIHSTNNPVLIRYHWSTTTIIYRPIIKESIRVHWVKIWFSPLIMDPENLKRILIGLLFFFFSFFGTFWAGFRSRSREPDGSETLRHPVEWKHIFFYHSRNITKKFFFHESTIFWALGAGSRYKNRRLRKPGETFSSPSVEESFHSQGGKWLSKGEKCHFLKNELISSCNPSINQLKIKNMEIKIHILSQNIHESK